MKVVSTITDVGNHSYECILKIKNKEIEFKMKRNYESEMFTPSQYVLF